MNKKIGITISKTAEERDADLIAAAADAAAAYTAVEAAEAAAEAVAADAVGADFNSESQAFINYLKKYNIAQKVAEIAASTYAIAETRLRRLASKK